MAKISVKIDILKPLEGQLQSRISELEALNTRLEALLTRIGDSWEGEASQAYLNVLRNYAAQAANMVKVLTEFKNYVSKACSSFSSVDSDAASRISGSF